MAVRLEYSDNIGVPFTWNASRSRHVAAGLVRDNMAQDKDHAESASGLQAEQITRLLVQARHGDRKALDELFEAVYGELRRLAHHQRLAWRGDETLGTTALVNEAYLKLTRQEAVPWRDRGQFFATASKAMRHILINYAERRRAAKRGGGQEPAPLDESMAISDDTAEELLALDQALIRLEACSSRQTRVVECRFFGGLDIAQTAEALDVSPATVKRDWAMASTWLKREIGAGPFG